MSGNFYIVAAPSGAGKTSLTTALVESVKDIRISVSHTTRASRPGEQDGVQYHFVSKEKFQQMAEHDAFLEYAKVYDEYYGTSRDWVKEQISQGVDVILEIDWQGARQIASQFPQAISIFILPPSTEVLHQRLVRRQQDSEAVIKRRMAQARDEISHYAEFDYLVVNDDFGVALSDMKRIVLSQRLHTPVQQAKLGGLLSDLLGDTASAP